MASPINPTKAVFVAAKRVSVASITMTVKRKRPPSLLLKTESKASVLSITSSCVRRAKHKNEIAGAVKETKITTVL